MSKQSNQYHMHLLQNLGIKIPTPFNKKLFATVLLGMMPVLHVLDSSI